MSAALPSEKWDTDGYPTTEILDYIRFFDGTPRDLIAMVVELFRGGYASVEEGLSDTGRPGLHLRLATGGWSGCEDVVDALQNTMFWTVFWRSTIYGGGYDFHIPTEFLDLEFQWGRATETPPDPDTEQL